MNLRVHIDAMKKDSDDEIPDKIHHRAPMLRKRQDSMAVNLIPLHERNRVEFLTIILGGSMLAFNAGFINGCTLLSLHSYPVSHVTGTTSHAGLHLASEEYDLFGIELSLIVCFIFGAAITGYWMPMNSFQLGKKYGPLFIIGSVLLLLACITSQFRPESYWFFYFASMASGLQNSLTSKYSGNIIRTTHLTGAATDIGIVLGRMANGDYKDIWKLQVLVPISLSFFIGGFFSKFAVDRLGRLSLMINVIIFFSIGLVYSIFISYKISVPVLSVFCGTYTNTLSGAKNKVKNVLVKARIIKNRIQTKVKFLYPKRSDKTDVDVDIHDHSTDFETYSPGNLEENSSYILDVDSHVKNPLH